MKNSNKPTVRWLKEQRCLHIETHNCIVNIRADLTDMKGREVTSVEIIRDEFAGELPTRLVGRSINRVIRLKHERKTKKLY